MFIEGRGRKAKIQPLKEASPNVYGTPSTSTRKRKKAEVITSPEYLHALKKQLESQKCWEGNAKRWVLEDGREKVR